MPHPDSPQHPLYPSQDWQSHPQSQPSAPQHAWPPQQQGWQAAPQHGTYPPQQWQPHSQPSAAPVSQPSAAPVSQPSAAPVGAPPAEQEPSRPPKKSKADKAARAAGGRGKGASWLRRSPESQEKAAKEKARRAALSGVRYGGDRGKWWLMNAALVAMALLSVVSLLVAVSKPSRADMEAQVAKSLAEGGKDFPTGEAVMWAGQVIRIWGTWDEKSADGRALSIAPYLAPGIDPAAGWGGKGRQSVTYTSINPEPAVHDANHATITAAYQIDDGTWRCVGLPVYAYKPATQGPSAGWAFALAANPTPVPCAARPGIQPLPTNVNPVGQPGTEPHADVGRALGTDFFPHFFAAWASSDSAALTQFSASGVHLLGLGGAMASLPQPSIGETTLFADKDGVIVDGKTYYAVVPVTWTLSGSTAQVTSTYAVPVRRDAQKWAVAGEPAPLVQQAGLSGKSPGSLGQPADGTNRPSYPAPQVTPAQPPASSVPQVTTPAKTPS